MDTARVVEVWVPATRRVGSGYLLSDSLVLTSYHLLQGIGQGAVVEVRPLHDRATADPVTPAQAGPGYPWLESRLCWPVEPVDIDAAPEWDAALLVIGDSRWRSGPFPGRVRFGQLTGGARARCEGLGFPDAEARPDGVRDTMRVLGRADPLQGLKSGLLSVHIDEGIVPRRLAGGSGWAGSSGTALFCGPLLVAVLATDRAIAAQASVLGAVPVSGPARLPGFRDTLAFHGLDLHIEPAPVPETERFLGPYLSAAFKAADRHPYPLLVPGDRPPPSLTAVYVRQEVRHSREPAERDVTRAVTAAADEVLAADDVLTHTGTGILVAEPGGGKSSLLRSWTTDLVGRLSHGQVGQVPVLVQAAKLIPDPDNPVPLPDALAAAATAELSAYGLREPLPPSFFRVPPMHQAHWLVLVDGLDEVTAARSRERLLSMLAAQERQLYRFIVATRPAPDRELSALGTDVPRYALQRFTPEDLHTVVKAWMATTGSDPAAAGEIFMRTLERTRMTDLAQVPLMASMLCQIYVNNPAQPLPRGRTALYAEFLDLLRRHRDTPGPGGLRAQTTADMARHGTSVLKAALHVLDKLPTLLEHLAAERQAGNGTPTPDLIATHRDALLPSDAPEDFPPGEWHRFLNTSLRRSGLLTARAGELVFWHQTLQEYFAARHMTRDPHTREQVLQQVFQQSGRFGPRTAKVGLKPRMWLRRYSEPPLEDSSYVSFLLDTAHEHDPHAGAWLLKRLAGRGGLDGCTFIVDQARLRTHLPQDVIRTAAGTLDALAREATEVGISQQKATKVLGELGGPHATELLHALALDSTLYEGARTGAAEALAVLGDPRGADLLYGLARDPTLGHYFQGETARALAKAGDPRAADQVHAYGLALALKNPISAGGNVHTRRAVAQELADMGDPRGADLLYGLALDDIARDDNSRTDVARQLAGLSDPRAPDLLYDIALDTTIVYDSRTDAALALSGLGDSRAPDLLNTLALDTALGDYSRTRTARRLGELGDPRAKDLLHTLALNAIYANSRAEAAQALAALGDIRGAELLHAIAIDLDTDALDRLNVAVALGELGDPRGADLLHTSALDPTLEDYVRMLASKDLAELADRRGAHLLRAIALDAHRSDHSRTDAASALVALGEPGSADLLHTLALDTTLDDYFRTRTARQLGKLGDPRGADLLYGFARGTLHTDLFRTEAAQALAELGDPRIPELSAGHLRLSKALRRGQRGPS